jgi:hypothetical protein
MSKLYTQCDIEIDIEPLFQDLIDKILDVHPANSNNRAKGFTLSDTMKYREEIAQRQDRMSQWFVKRGYQCGLDYFVSEQGFRVKNPATVTAFMLEFAV